MNRRSWWLASWWLTLMFTTVDAELPQLQLGPKPSFGLFQPRVTVEIFQDAEGQQSLGPASASFLLDTGASGVVLYPPATTELQQRGFVNEGSFEEIGIAGTDTFQVSSPYRLDYQGTAGATQHIDQVRMLSGDCAPDPTGLMELHGILGMPAMRGKVTSIDNRVRQGALPLSMGVTFGDALPASSTHRFTVPLQPLAFPAEGEGPLPSFASLSTLQVISQHGTTSVTRDIVLDSGAQFTILSSDIAIALGLDANGNGDLLDEAITTVPLSGVSGKIDAPVLSIDRIRIPTEQEFELTWTDAEVVVFDIHPEISGVLGADFMSDDGGLNLSLLGGGAGGLTDLLGPLLGGETCGSSNPGGGSGLDDLLGGGNLDDLLGGLLGGGGNLDDLLGGLLGSGADLSGLLGDLGNVAAADDGTDPFDDLLDSLLGGLLSGSGDLFASFPLDSYFDQVHFDFRDFPEGRGQLVFDVNPSVSSGILNGDHVFDALDIDDLTQAISSTDPRYDLNLDGLVDVVDRQMLIRDVLRALPGDTNLDGDVNFTDFLALTQGFGGAQAGWATGDFDGNGATNFADFLALADNFGRSATATASVPEPRSPLLLCLLVLPWLRRRS